MALCALGSACPAAVGASEVGAEPWRGRVRAVRVRTRRGSAGRTRSGRSARADLPIKRDAHELATGRDGRSERRLRARPRGCPAPRSKPASAASDCMNIRVCLVPAMLAHAALRASCPLFLRVDCDPDAGDGLEVGDVNVSYALHPWVRGRGVAVEAVRLICAFVRANHIGTRAAIRGRPGKQRVGTRRTQKWLHLRARFRLVHGHSRRRNARHAEVVPPGSVNDTRPHSRAALM